MSYAGVLANVASGLILAFGVIAALDQLRIATNVVNGILYATLAAAVGVIVIAVGGGRIKTMSERWEKVAAKYDEEKPKIAEAARNSPSVQDQAAHAKDHGEQSMAPEPPQEVTPKVVQIPASTSQAAPPQQ